METKSDSTHHTLRAFDTTPHCKEFRSMDTLIESYKAYLIPKRMRMRMRTRTRMRMRKPENSAVAAAQQLLWRPLAIRSHHLSYL